MTGFSKVLEAKPMTGKKKSWYTLRLDCGHIVERYRSNTTQSYPREVLCEDCRIAAYREKPK